MRKRNRKTYMSIVRMLFLFISAASVCVCCLCSGVLSAMCVLFEVKTVRCDGMHGGVRWYRNSVIRDGIQVTRVRGWQVLGANPCVHECICA